MDTKFFEEFRQATGGKYPMLKLGGAVYREKDRALTVRFIISAYELKNFDADKKADVKEVVSRMFDGIKTDVIFSPTYADENVVKNKVLEFFNATNQIVFRKINDETLSIEITDTQLNVTLMLDSAAAMLLTAGKLAEKLTQKLDSCFNLDVNVRVVEQAKIVGEEQLDLSPVMRTSSLRLIDAKVGEKVYARGKIEGIPQLPSYICDIKSEGDGVVICGKISNLQRRTYKNKKYDPENPKNGPQEKPIVSFLLNDTTGNMDCVCFPRLEDAKFFDILKDGDEVICTGKTAISSFKQALSYSVNALFRCSIDFGSVKPIQSKPAPKFYAEVSPKPYSEISQTDFLTAQEETPEFLKDKTVVVFDLETTSKFISEAEIIEIGAIKMENGVPTETFSTLVKPSGSIPADASKINHITDDMVALSPTIDKVLPDFFKFTRGATLAGHNIGEYDMPILLRVANEQGYIFDNPIFDTLTKARELLPGRSHYGLEIIAKDMNFTHTNAHRALSDVEANMQLLQLLAKKL